MCAGLAITIAACGSQASAGSPTPSQLLADGAQSLTTLQSMQVTGSYEVDGTTGSVQTSIVRDGNATGSLNLNDTESAYIFLNGTTYYEMPADFVLADVPSEIATLAPLLKDKPWWNDPGSDEASAVITLLTPDVIKSTFLTGRSSLTETNAKDSSGRPALKLTDAAGSVFLATSTPHNVLEIKTAPHYLAGEFSSVDIVFNDFSKPVSISAPADAVIPSLSSMPAHFFVQSDDLNGCNSSGCTDTAVIGADAGSGTATVTMTITASGKTLSVCTAKVVLASYEAQPTASCRAHSAAWTNWWGHVDGSYELVATVANPAYTS
jgi:hypothetical protein